ncbi:CsbD family protein [Pseudomonas sp. TMP9]|uniref:CsbD family protein n=1 Tax=unclassified Pseudomonas TaxID=196821 RepID=UPI0030D083B1
MNLPALQHLKGQWRQHLGAMRMAWARALHNPELHHAGHMQRLAGLLQARYGFSRSDADAQVQGFFARKSQRDSGPV